MDPMPPVRRCMSSIWATSFIMSPTPSRTRVATRSSSNGVMTMFPGVPTKWSLLKTNCAYVPPPSLPRQSHHLKRACIHQYFILRCCFSPFSSCAERFKTCKDICLQSPRWQNFHCAKDLCVTPEFVWGKWGKAKWVAWFTTLRVRVAETCSVSRISPLCPVVLSTNGLIREC